MTGQALETRKKTIRQESYSDRSFRRVCKERQLQQIIDLMDGMGNAQDWSIHSTRPEWTIPHTQDQLPCGRIGPKN